MESPVLPSWVPLSSLDERLACDPDSLCRIDRLATLRYLGGRLRASQWPAERWLGAALAKVAEGESAEDAFRLRQAPESRRSVARLARLHRRDKALLELRAALGTTDQHALQVLRGEVACPPEHMHLVIEAREARCPAGANAIGTARRRFTTWETLSRESGAA